MEENAEVSNFFLFLKDILKTSDVKTDLFLWIDSASSSDILAWAYYLP